MEKPEYVVDSVAVQITVARMEGGRKVAEYPFNAVKLLYPFDLAALCEEAVERIGAEREASAGA